MAETNAIVLSYETGIIPATKKQIVIGIVKSYLDEFDKELPERMAESVTFVIKDQASRELATMRRLEATAAAKDIAAKRKALLGPPKKDIVEIEAMFNKVQHPINAIEKNYDAEIGRDFMEQRRIKQEQEAILAAEAKKQQEMAQEALIAQALDQNDENLLTAAESVFVPEVKLADVERTTHTEAGSTNVRVKKVLEIADKMEIIRKIASNHYPLGYAEVSLAFIQKDYDKNQWAEMPGFKIVEKPIPRGRTK